jgi:hypothetical protein
MSDDVCWRYLNCIHRSLYYLAFQSEKPRKKQVKKEKDENRPKRPPTAFMLYLNANRDKIKSENPGIAVTDIAKKGGEMWRDMEDKSVCVSCACMYLH